MFDQLNHQNWADTMKGWVDGYSRNHERAGPPSAARKRTLDLIGRFESRGWNPFAFERAVAEAAPGSIRVEEFKPIFDGEDILHTLQSILIRYNQLIETREVLSTNDAADYLGIAVITLKKYIHDSHEITGTMMGNSLMFTRQQLDEFYAKPRRPVGRPRKATAEPLDN